MARKSATSKVIFRDGVIAAMLVYIYEGACVLGDPTAYVYRDGQMVWVVQLQSSDAWIEA